MAPSSRPNWVTRYGYLGIAIRAILAMIYKYARSAFVSREKVKFLNIFFSASGRNECKELPDMGLVNLLGLIPGHVSPIGIAGPGVPEWLKNGVRRVSGARPCRERRFDARCSE